MRGGEGAVSRQAGLRGEWPSTPQRCRLAGNRKKAWMVA